MSIRQWLETQTEDLNNDATNMVNIYHVLTSRSVMCRQKTVFISLSNCLINIKTLEVLNCVSVNCCNNEKMSSIKEAKAILRKTIETKLGKLTHEEKQRQSEVVLKKLFSLPEFEKSRNIGVYLSIENEINTEPILRKMFEQNKKCFAPRYKKSLKEMVRLYSMEDWETLPLTKLFNIKQPSFKDERENAFEAGLDLIIIPGVAFSSDGRRLGHGTGFYDEYLTKIKQIQNPFIVALAFKEQVVDDVPTEDNDVLIDMILYDE